MKKPHIIFSTLTLMIMISCGSKFDTAKESLIGTWSVKEIFRFDQSTGLTSEDNSGIGTFTFTDTTCDYNYVFQSTTEERTFDYQFEVSKENAGFTRVDRFDIVGEENYRVKFGDETSDSHQEATEASLERTLITDSITYEYFITIEKQ